MGKGAVVGGVSKANVRRLVAAVLLYAGSMALKALFPQLAPVAFPAYRRVTAAVVGLLATVCSVAPFALWDVVLACWVVALGVAAARVRKTGPGQLVALLTRSMVLLAVVHLLLVAWALNHYAPPLAIDLDLEVDTYSTDELADTCAYHLREAARLAPQVPRDAEGTLEPQDFYELARIAGASYGPLAARWEVFEGVRVPVKALLVWGYPLLYSGHNGVFFAATGEATVPVDCADADKPFAMCHEAAHRLGIASEQEANLAAILACDASDDLRFCYSGSFKAFSFCLNALWAQDQERAQRLVQEVADDGLAGGVALVLGDYRATHAHYDAYEGPFEKVGAKANDSYLKSYGEQTGIRSYGLVVDYLIAWHLQDIAA